MARTTKQRSISLDPSVVRRGLARAKQRGFGKSFSAYVNRLIEEDDQRLNGGAAALLGAGVLVPNGKGNGR